jgi:hypothetical protein
MCTSFGKNMGRMDLYFYHERFRDALRARYDGRTFDEGFRRIENLYREVRAGDRLLVVADVMQIIQICPSARTGPSLTERTSTTE